jgi:hypothetical protein
MKMIAKKEFKTVVFTICFMLNSVLIFAQDTEEGPEGPPTGSINSNLGLMIMIAILFGVYIVYNKTAKNTSKQL